MDGNVQPAQTIAYNYPAKWHFCDFLGNDQPGSYSN
jgi:hypothetical protein